LTRPGADRAQHRQVLILVVVFLVCAWLTVSAAILETMIRIGWAS
jgi:hypothetical protein